MTTREIIQQYLKANNYDGLVSNSGCGCDIDHLAPCEHLNLDECFPAYKTKCRPRQRKCGDEVPECEEWGCEISRSKECYSRRRLTTNKEGEE